MHPQALTRLCVSVAILVAASCTSSKPHSEREVDPVPPDARHPARAERTFPPPPVKPIGLNVARPPFSVIEEDEGPSTGEWILYGPTNEPEDDGKETRALDPQMNRRRWWIDRPSASERAALAGIFRAEEGWYIGPMYGFTTHDDSDLDGQKFLTGPDTIVLPEIDAGSGPGIVFGYRFETMAFELRYLRTKHDGQWLGNDFNLTYETFAVDFKQFFRRERRLQPFVMLGFSIPKLTIDNGSFSGLSVDDGILQDDLAAELGGGIGFYVTPRVFIGGHCVYRFLETYNEAEGVAAQGPSGDVDAGGFLGAITVTYTL